MKKRFVTMLLAAAVAVTAVPYTGLQQPQEVEAAVADADVQTEGDFQYTVAGGKATLVKYTGTAEEVTVPDKLGGAAVTVIGRQAFYNNATLRRVQLPDTVTEIGGEAFSMCQKLEDAKLPPHIEELGVWAFSFSKIKSVKLPASLVAMDESFRFCQSLETVICDDQLEKFDLKAFSLDAGLRSIQLGKNTKVFDAGGGRYDTDWGYERKMQPVIEVPDDSPYLKTVDGVLFTKDGETLLFYSPGLTATDYTVPDGTKVIGKNAFDSADTLKTVELPDTLTMIESDAFANCRKLSGIELPDGVTGLGERAFSFCRELSEIRFSDSLTDIGDFAFSGCAALTKAELPDSVKTMGTGAFRECSALASVRLSASLQKIGEVAFASDKKLLEISIPDSVRSIGYRAFSSCSSLKTVNLPSTLRSVDIGAFASSGVRTVTVGGKNTTFARGAFDTAKVTAVCAKGSKAYRFFKKKNTNAKRIIYNLNGGVNHAANAYYFTKTRTLKAPTKTGYAFCGWYADKACTRKLARVQRGRSYTVYAKWKKA